MPRFKASLANQIKNENQPNQNAKDKRRKHPNQLTPQDTVKFKKFCTDNGLPEPQAEYKFHVPRYGQKKRLWRNDFYFELDHNRVGLEIEGGVHSNGRHVRPLGFLEDMKKYNAMAQQGIHLLRTTPEQLFTGETIRMIRNVLNLD